ncbi:MAG: integrase family protein [Rhodospirillales bacterium]|nr:integrase family protein [Rhodospirillales bacterium]
MGPPEYDPGAKDRRPWNADRKIGAKRALRPQQVWAIRFWLERERRLRDRAMFDLAIDSKWHGCDIVKVRIGDRVSGGRVRSRTIVIQQKTGRPSSTHGLSPLVAAFWLGLNVEEARSTTSYFRVGSTIPITSAPASTLGLWMSG